MRTETFKLGNETWVNVYGTQKDKHGIYRGTVAVYCRQKNNLKPEYYADLIQNKRWGFTEDILSEKEYLIHERDMAFATSTSDPWADAFEAGFRTEDPSVTGPTPRDPADYDDESEA